MPPPNGKEAAGDDEENENQDEYEQGWTVPLVLVLGCIFIAMDVSRIHRLLRLITLLQSGRGYTATDLARELEVSRRTVFRDLNVLEMAHHCCPR